MVIFIKNVRPIITSEEEKALVHDYISGMPIKQILTKYNFKTAKSITDKVKKYYPDTYKDIFQSVKDKHKSYSIDLSVIDSEFDAYFIGLLMTDGYVLTNGYGFGLDLTDEDCIKFISDITNKPYHTYRRDAQDHKDRYRVIYNDIKTVKDLERYGIVRNKSLTIQPPILYPSEEKYIPYLLRGAIDGNGCLTYTSYNKPWLILYSASKDLAVWYADTLENKIYMRNVVIRLNETNGHAPMWRVELTNTEDFYKLKAVIYDKPFGMNRKYALLREMLRDYYGDNSIAS